MKIITVNNGAITKIFSDEQEDFIVVEGGNCRDTTMREVKSLPLAHAGSMRDIELTGGMLAKYRDLSVTEGNHAFYINKGDKEICIGDGVDMFEDRGRQVRAGTLLFQANLLPFLMDPETKKAYSL
jgi:hypothetical protein